jgi:hypothetical protein
MQESPDSAFDSRPEVEGRLRSTVQRLRLLEDLFRVCLYAQHADVDFDFSEEAFGGLTEFCAQAADDLSELAHQLPVSTLCLRLPEVVEGERKGHAARREIKAKKGRRMRRRSTSRDELRAEGR